jgi:hypothetical protein
MASKIDLVKAELSFHGIRVMDDGSCFSFMEGQDEPVKSSCRDKIQQLKYDLEVTKNGVRGFWEHAISTLRQPLTSFTGGSPSTEKMFVSSLKMALRLARKYRFFKKDIPVIKYALKKDIKRFTETNMSRFVDYVLCVQWSHYIVKQSAYCISLLSFFEKHRNMLADAIKNNVPVIAQQMVPSGTMDMEGDESDPLKERRWAWDDESEDLISDREGKYLTDITPKNGFFFVQTDPTQGLDALYDKDGENDPYKGKIKPFMGHLGRN